MVLHITYQEVAPVELHHMFTHVTAMYCKKVARMHSTQLNKALQTSNGHTKYKSAYTRGVSQYQIP